MTDTPRDFVSRSDDMGHVPVNDVNIAVAKPLSQFLRMAVMAGVETAVQIHVERGDDLDARDVSGMTPLMLCAARNRPAICKLLLSAGADHSLLAPSGKTALEIAIAAGSEEAAAILYAARTPLNASEIEAHPLPETPPTPLLQFGAPVVRTVSDELENDGGRPESEISADSHSPKLDMLATVILNEVDDGEFDLSGWETEEEPSRPDIDFAVLDSASSIQITITAHEPIDSSAGWDDIDIHLPEVAMPLARAGDVEGRAQLRRLLLRAFREGSVPRLDVQVQSTNEDRSANLEAEAYLSMVINDLGAEVDERFEYSSANESFEVFIEPEETPDEEVAIDEALVAIDRAASPRHEPLRIYQREFQRLHLLTAEEEIQLAKDMEAALEAALDSLAVWPGGIARTLAAGAQAISGSRSISSIWSGSAEPDPGSLSPESLEAEGGAYHAPEARLDDDGEQMEFATAVADESSFSESLRQLTALIEGLDETDDSIQEIRQALAGLRLNRRFLVELIDAAHGSEPCPGFARCMADFRKARDRMTGANLKLAFFHAKKYLYSGEPLDDLAQEGNIGLLKAVDRYDWRRGFRFSTYATWWIRQQISRFIADKARTIRIPVHIYEKIQRMERVARTFEVAAGRVPTLAELAEIMEMSEQKVTSLLSIAPEPSAIDELNIDSMVAIDARSDYVSPDPSDVVNNRQLNKAVDRYISSLSATDRKEERILRLRFGIGIDEALTLEEIGARFHVTRERIRQIEAKAIRKLRHPVRSKSFASLVLGFASEENILVHGEREPDDADGSEAAKAAVLPAMAKQPALPRSPRESMQSADSSKSSLLDRILAQATDLGISVEDDRLGSGRIWVGLLEAREGNHRKLVRQLFELGFQFWPGKGYWR